MKDFFESEEYKEIVMKAAEQSCRDMKWTVIKAEILKEFEDRLTKKMPQPTGWNFIEMGMAKNELAEEIDFISNLIDKALTARDEEWKNEYNLMLSHIINSLQKIYHYRPVGQDFTNILRLGDELTKSMK